ncbi:23S rRNA (cytidine(2498)-2'-O)-methyltransferase RlmM [Phytohalomonas tamaricis]|uniref:23S rRNA (cytidine(2498)-2'-O)-methyltransferase RlmM n=1 Tax=Phytohalomonas tamaricis TaxID=2081032 RepID=UPI000D0B0B1D|nr:23S rRNA (cytidine(2498)-2'-O)-methyltransferase RlmM [Phytohalomonas tamaricis]
MNTPTELLLYCRAGFETDLAVEITEKAAVLGFAGYPLAISGSGHVRFATVDDNPVNKLHQALSLRSLVFARQSLVAFAPLENLSRQDRISPIIEQIVASGWNFEALWQETPDTNDGKALAGLIKSLQQPLEGVLKKRGALKRRAGGRRLHLFWTHGDCVQVAMSFPGNRSELPGGIRHLKFPREAPSRSTLKLEEAWHEFLPRETWPDMLHDGMQAADLGAAPGGWTYQLVRKGMYVYAIDNGPMDSELMRSGMIDHLREDGFVWAPPQRLDWLVCDIVDRPMRVTEMVERWLTKRWCWQAVFNLKLPMKRRWQEVSLCLEKLQNSLKAAGIKAEIACRHLYHDREEVTVYVRLLD